MFVNDQKNINIEKYYDYIVANSYLRAQPESGFISLEECAIEHSSDILKNIVEIYLNIKMKLYTKNMVSFKPTNRQKLTKLILFEGN